MNKNNFFEHIEKQQNYELPKSRMAQISDGKLCH